MVFLLSSPSLSSCSGAMSLTSDNPLFQLLVSSDQVSFPCRRGRGAELSPLLDTEAQVERWREERARWVNLLHPVVGSTARRSSSLHLAVPTLVDGCMLAQECQDCHVMVAPEYNQRGAQLLCMTCYNRSKRTELVVLP